MECIVLLCCVMMTADKSSTNISHHMMKMLSSNCESLWKARSISGRILISIWLSSKKWKSSRSIMFMFSEYLEVSFFIMRG